MRRVLSVLALALNLSAQNKAPKIWDEKALEDWTTPIAALRVRPGHFSSAEYYAVAAQNLKTYPVYRPDREPPGYWDSLQRQKPQLLVDRSKIHSQDDWIKAGQAAFQTMDDPALRRDDPADGESCKSVKIGESGSVGVELKDRSALCGTSATCRPVQSAQG